MNKKILALAVGSALGLAPLVAPQAKVTVYGHAQIEIAEFDTGSASDGIAVDDNARGRIGIKASEKLGNGMTAIAKFEWRVDTDVGGNAAGGRESYVGLKGSFGTVELGNLRGPYKYYGGTTYDAFVASTLEARGGSGGMSAGELGNSSYGTHSFIANSIGYKSNNFSGLTFWVVYSPEEFAGTGTNGAAKGSDGDYSIGAKYKNGPMEVGFAAVENDTGAAANGGSATKIFGKYKWGNHTFLGQYENLDRDINNNGGTEIDMWFFGYRLKAGNNTFVVQVGNAEVDAVGGVETDYYTVGMIHSLSKKTRIFGGFRNTDAGTNGETDVVSVGLRMLF